MEPTVEIARESEPGGRPGRSFERFFADEYERLGRALFLLTGETGEAEEIAQEAMVRVWERWDRVKDMESPAGYLYRTALNLHRSRLRRLQRAGGEWTQRRRDRIAAVEDRDELDRALAALPVEQRAALILVEWLGMSSIDAGRVLRIEPVSVRVRITRAKRTLREAREQEPG